VSEVSLRIEGRQLPGAGFNRIQVGVQRRTDVEQTVPGDAATATFSLSVDVVKSPSGMDFRGPYVQGRKGERFLYLSWGLRGEDGTHEMFRRAKLHLSAIDTSSVERAVSEELPLVGALALTDEQREPLCASVRPPQITWEVDPLPRLRSLCLSLPETTERPSHGEPTWFIRDKKTFVSYANRHHDDRVGFWCAAPPGAQDALMGSDPSHFFRPPYVGHRGWLGVYLDVPVDWDHIGEIVADAYRTVAPKSLATVLNNR
jgi:predicted DNA-binding protein (MmcQ/YjbR family)